MPTNAHKDIELATISEESNHDVVLNIEDDSDDICVICLEDYDKGEPIHFRCGHVFHIHCVLDWTTSLFRNNADISCPICRSIECRSNSPIYIQLRRAIYPAEQPYNPMWIRSNEVQRRVQDNNLHANQIVHQNIPQTVTQQDDDGLFKTFMKFVTFLTIIGIAFLFYLIYTVGHR
jgi:Ring finger domain